MMNKIDGEKLRKEWTSLMAKHLEAPIKDLIANIWSDGPPSEEYDEEEDNLMDKHSIEDFDVDGVEKIWNSSIEEITEAVSKTLKKLTKS